MNTDNKKICGRCKHGRQEIVFGTHYCGNPESDYYECENDYDDSCDEFEEEK